MAARRSHLSLLTDDQKCRIVREDVQQRRRLRLLQVRSQSHAIAKKLRGTVQTEKSVEIAKLRADRRACLQKEQDRQLNLLKAECELVHMLHGQADRDAQKLNQEVALRSVEISEQRTTATHRHRSALRALHSHIESENHGKKVSISRDRSSLPRRRLNTDTLPKSHVQVHKFRKHSEARQVAGQDRRGLLGEPQNLSPILLA